MDMSFRKTKLEKRVKSIVSARVDRKDDKMIPKKTRFRKGLSFVVSLRKGGSGVDVNTPTLFRSYKGIGYSPDCEIWEAARATTAAPRYFAPAKITVEGRVQYFKDGAVKWNNPTKLLLEEAKSHFGRHRNLGCLVSLGTGLRPSPLKEKGGGRFGKTYSVFEIGKMAADIITDPEVVHIDMQNRFKGHLDSYFRFTVPCIEGEERIRIHEYKRMESLLEATKQYLKKKAVSDQLDELVGVLINNSATELTLHAACESHPKVEAFPPETNCAGHANSPETAMEHITHKLRHRKTTSPIFTGCTGILRVLAEDVFFPRTPGSTPRRDFWLSGPSGIGKTQIALQFVDLYRDKYDPTPLSRARAAFTLVAIEANAT